MDKRLSKLRSFGWVRVSGRDLVATAINFCLQCPRFDSQQHIEFMIVCRP